MHPDKLLDIWTRDATIAENIAAHKTRPSRQAKFVPFPLEIHANLTQALQETGIHQLYSHQAEAYNLIKQGKHVVISTFTASGKTLCYNLPVLDTYLKAPETCALFLFPTKALAQDQFAQLEILASKIKQNLTYSLDLPVSTYDGDTPRHLRQKIREKAHLLITNPDMLHIGILPQHTSWVNFFSRLRYVVIDEMHVFRGVFGSHVSNVLRRLKRITRHYGSDPQFILTSATIANPGELAKKLIEHPVEIIDDDSSERGPQEFLLYNPPIVNQDLGIRKSALQESLRLAKDLLDYKLQTIVFVPSRRAVEITLTYLREQARVSINSRRFDKDDLVDIEEKIQGYRSGYLPKERRAIERGLREGIIQTVIATNALELGLNIGQMTAALLVGYPGSISSTLQQAGRAGRGKEKSLAILIASSAPLDQYIVSHPEYLFSASPEQALINPDNPLILLDHIQCAAFELPFRQQEGFGELDPAVLEEFFSYLEGIGVFHSSNSQYFWMSDQYPAQKVSLRSLSGSPVIIKAMTPNGEKTIGQVDFSSAHWMVHPQAVYMHLGQIYLVQDLDFEQHTASLIPVESDYFTEPKMETQIEVLKNYRKTFVPGGHKSFGEIKVTSQLTGFRKIQFFTHEILGAEALSLPPVELITNAYWLTIDEETVVRLRDEGLWNNDPNNYGPNWAKQRLYARQRDGFRCRNCGKPEDEREHDVHHIIPFRSFESFVHANTLDNLVTLCPACHRKAETVVRMRSGLAGLAYILKHLAPLFVLCDAQDLGVHSDPQAPFAEGNPIIVIYDQIPAGIGLARRLYDEHAHILRASKEQINHCPCEDGCPSCTGPAGEHGVGSKRETLALLNILSQDDAD